MIFLALVAIVILVAGVMYNRLVILRNRGDEAWSGIDVQLKRRYDLIPNLVEVVKGYASFEQSTLQKVIEARNAAMSSGTMEKKAETENALSGALKGIFALAEGYPDLKANQSFLDLQRSLIEVEDTLQMARRYYNAVIRDFNIACESFPSMLIATMFHFSPRQFFQAQESERASVTVTLP